jgi:hypothetical protein
VLLPPKALAAAVSSLKNDLVDYETFARRPTPHAIRSWPGPTPSTSSAIVGVVSQETYLLHTTVRENLRYAKPDATDAQIEDAAHAAQIHDLIASLRHRGRRPRQADGELGPRRGPGCLTVAQNPNSQ